MKDKKELFGNLAYAVAGGLLGLTCLMVSNSGRNYLKPEDFSKAKWIESRNTSGIIWDEYMDENIVKNQFNWHLYIDEVREKNNNNLEGKIFLPDLDGDGNVGK